MSPHNKRSTVVLHRLLKRPSSAQCFYSVKIVEGDMHGPAILIESALQNDGVVMRINRGEGDQPSSIRLTIGRPGSSRY